MYGVYSAIITLLTTLTGNTYHSFSLSRDDLRWLLLKVGMLAWEPAGC